MAAKKLAKIFPNILKSRWFKRLGLVIGGLLVFMAVLFLGYNLVYSKRIFPHTYIGGTNFGGKNYEDAHNTLLGLENSFQNASLIYSYQDEINQLTLEDLEVDFEQRNLETLTTLLEVGRSGSLGKIIKEQFRAVFLKNQAYSVFNYSQEKLADYLQKIAQKIDKPAKDASIEIQDQKASVIEAEIGQQFPLEKNQQIALERIGSFALKGQLPFIIEPIYPEVSTAAAEMAIAATEDLINRHLILKAPKNTFHLYPQDIASLIEFPKKISKGVLGEQSGKEASLARDLLTIYTISPELSRLKVAELTEKIAQEIYQEPKDARFEVQSGKVVAFQLAQTGYELDKDQASAIIVQAIKDGQTKVELPVKVTESEYTSESPESIGLKEKIGEGTTDFSGSPQNRRHNIKVGAMTFHGVLVKPGEEFSMLKYLGEVDASTGYLPELVIKEDRTIPEYGGGLCQVSTTMFRAALNTGLKITERQNHSYRVRYYEPPVGMDATIYMPKPDLRFLNDMDKPILIQASVGSNTLTFSFYGTLDGRRSETTEPYVYDVTGSGEPVYTESPDLAPGEIKQIEKPHPGSKASFTYRVFDSAGKLINEQTFQSSYVPWPARYLYGPGTPDIPGQAPPAEPPPPAEPTPTPAPSPTRSSRR